MIRFKSINIIYDDDDAGKISSMEKKEGEMLKIYNKALLLLKDKKLEEAEIEFNNVLEIYEEYNELNMGREDKTILKLSGKRKSAEQNKKKSTVENIYYLTIKNLGINYQEKGDIEKAIKMYSDVLLIESELIIWYNLGICYKIVGNLGVSKSCFERVYILDPNFYPSLYQLIHIYYLIGDVEESLSITKALLAVVPQNDFAKSIFELLSKHQLGSNSADLEKKILSLLIKYCDTNINFASHKKKKLEENIDNENDMIITEDTPKEDITYSFNDYFSVPQKNFQKIIQKPKLRQITWIGLGTELKKYILQMQNARVTPLTHSKIFDPNNIFKGVNGYLGQPVMLCISDEKSMSMEGNSTEIADESKVEGDLSLNSNILDEIDKEKFTEDQIKEITITDEINNADDKVNAKLPTDEKTTEEEKPKGEEKTTASKPVDEPPSIPDNINNIEVDNNDQMSIDEDQLNTTINDHSAIFSEDAKEHTLNETKENMSDSITDTSITSEVLGDEPVENSISELVNKEESKKDLNTTSNTDSTNANDTPSAPSEATNELNSSVVDSENVTAAATPSSTKETTPSKKGKTNPSSDVKKKSRRIEAQRNYETLENSIQIYLASIFVNPWAQSVENGDNNGEASTTGGEGIMLSANTLTSSSHNLKLILNSLENNNKEKKKKERTTKDIRFEKSKVIQFIHKYCSKATDDNTTNTSLQRINTADQPVIIGNSGMIDLTKKYLLHLCEASFEGSVNWNPSLTSLILSHQSFLLNNSSAVELHEVLVAEILFDDYKTKTVNKLRTFSRCHWHVQRLLSHLSATGQFNGADLPFYFEVRILWLKGNLEALKGNSDLAMTYLSNCQAQFEIIANNSKFSIPLPHCPSQTSLKLKNIEELLVNIEFKSTIRKAQILFAEGKYRQIILKLSKLLTEEKEKKFNITPSLRIQLLQYLLKSLEKENEYNKIIDCIIQLYIQYTQNRIKLTKSEVYTHLEELQERFIRVLQIFTSDKQKIHLLDQINVKDLYVLTSITANFILQFHLNNLSSQQQDFFIQSWETLYYSFCILHSPKNDHWQDFNEEKFEFYARGASIVFQKNNIASKKKDSFLKKYIVLLVKYFEYVDCQENNKSNEIEKKRITQELLPLISQTYNINLLKSQPKNQNTESGEGKTTNTMSMEDIYCVFWTICHTSGSITKMNMTNALKVLYPFCCELPKQYEKSRELVDRYLTEANVDIEVDSKNQNIDPRFQYIYENCYHLFVVHQICDPEKEIDFIKNAIATNPKNKDPWLLLARKYAHKVYVDIDKPNLAFNRKEFIELAEKCYDKASLFDASNYDKWMERAMFNYNVLFTDPLNDQYYRNAFESFTRCNEIDSDHYLPYYYLGKLKEKRKNLYSFEEYLSMYKKAVEYTAKNDKGQFTQTVEPFYRLHASVLKLILSCYVSPPPSISSSADHAKGFFDSSHSQLYRALVKFMYNEINEDNINDNELAMAIYEDCLKAMEDCRKKEFEKAKFEKFHSSIYQLAVGIARGPRDDIQKSIEIMSELIHEKKSNYYLTVWRLAKGDNYEIVTKRPGKYTYYYKKYMKFWMELLAKSKAYDHLANSIQKIFHDVKEEVIKGFKLDAFLPFFTLFAEKIENYLRFLPSLVERKAKLEIDQQKQRNEDRLKNAVKDIKLKIEKEVQNIHLLQTQLQQSSQPNAHYPSSNSFAFSSIQIAEENIAQLRKQLEELLAQQSLFASSSPSTPPPSTQSLSSFSNFSQSLPSSLPPITSLSPSSSSSSISLPSISSLTSIPPSSSQLPPADQLKLTSSIDDPIILVDSPRELSDHLPSLQSIIHPSPSSSEPSTPVISEPSTPTPTAMVIEQNKSEEELAAEKAADQMTTELMDEPFRKKLLEQAYDLFSKGRTLSPNVNISDLQRVVINTYKIYLQNHLFAEENFDLVLKLMSTVIKVTNIRNPRKRKSPPRT